MMRYGLKDMHDTKKTHPKMRFFDYSAFSRQYSVINTDLHR